MHLLIGYASVHGSTAEIAEYMGKEFLKRDFEVTVQNVAEVQSLDEYDAFILGSAIDAGMWLQGMSLFLERFEDVLKVRPLLFFIVCIRVMEPDGYEHVLREYVNHRVLDKLNLKALTAFAGRLDYSRTDWDERWTLAARYDGKSPPGGYDQDFRDWDKIHEWTSTAADILLSQVSHRR